MEEKNGFHQPENQFPLAGIRLLFKNWISTSGKENVQIKEYCFKQTENRFPLAGMENLFKNTFLLDEKTAYIGRNI